MSPRKAIDSPRYGSRRQKRLGELALKLEKSLQKEKQLHAKIETLREESARISKMFEASPSALRPPERRKRPRH